jgi:hypothetical protein
MGEAREAEKAARMPGSIFRIPGRLADDRDEHGMLAPQRVVPPHHQ